MYVHKAHLLNMIVHHRYNRRYTEKKVCIQGVKKRSKYILLCVSVRVRVPLCRVRACPTSQWIKNAIKRRYSVVTKKKKEKKTKRVGAEGKMVAENRAPCPIFVTSRGERTIINFRRGNHDQP